MEYGKIESSDKPEQPEQPEQPETGLEIDDNTKQVKDKRRKLVCKVLGIVVLFCLFIFYIFAEFVYYPEDNNSEYKKDELVKLDTDISARFPLHHHHHHHIKCSDYKFGCCEIYYDCDKGNHKKLTISPYKIVKHDEEGSNCLSLNTLVNQYNEAYKSDDSESGKCSINTMCDSSVRGIQGSVMHLVSLDIDEYHCNSFPMLINLYESGWPIQYTLAEEFIIMMGIMFLFMVCLAG